MKFYRRKKHQWLLIQAIGSTHEIIILTLICLGELTLKKLCLNIYIYMDKVMDTGKKSILLRYEAAQILINKVWQDQLLFFSWLFETLINWFLF